MLNWGECFRWKTSRFGMDSLEVAMAVSLVAVVLLVWAGPFSTKVS